MGINELYFSSGKQKILGKQPLPGEELKLGIGINQPLR
jgi:hypothetical protein